MEELVKKYWYVGAGALALMMLLNDKPKRKPRRRLKVAYKPRKKRVSKPRYVKKPVGKKPAWMVKGSPEAKRHMAKLRRMRRS